MDSLLRFHNLISAKGVHKLISIQFMKLQNVVSKNGELLCVNDSNDVI